LTGRERFSPLARTFRTVISRQTPVVPLRRRARLRRPDLFVAAGRLTETNASLIRALGRFDVDAEWLRPRDIARRLAPDDAVLSRLDVRSTLDGVEEGIWELCRAERRGVNVLNTGSSLLKSHDKLATALALASADVRHPRTAQVSEQGAEPPLPLPVVLKPRFGSWGKDVVLCLTREEYDRYLADVAGRSWFRTQGVLVQELVLPQGYDVRLIVVCGKVIGAIERHAKPGEWRTNVALGAERRSAAPDDAAIELAVAAARAVGGDLVGIDLLPLPAGGYAVLEVNGAVDFTNEYSLDGGDVFEDVAELLASAVRPEAVAAAAGSLAPPEPSLAPEPSLGLGGVA
jgi:[lysine-biosynthesis-protein LysW]---L-2-aminoadipate ligase